MVILNTICMSTFQKNIRDYHMIMLTVTLCIYKISVFKEYLLLSASDSQLTQTNIQVQYCQFYCNAKFLVFNPTFRNIMATSFSGGRSQSTRREPPTMGKQLVNYITCGCESSASFFVIYKAGREPMPYWWYSCMLAWAFR